MILYFIAFLLTIMFFLSSIDKLINFNDTATKFNKRVKKMMFKVPSILTKLGIVCAIIIQFFCPLIIMYSLYNKKYHIYGMYASLMLVFFTILATYFYHFPPKGNKGKQYYAFMGNVTTVGGLSLMAYHLR